MSPENTTGKLGLTLDWEIMEVTKKELRRCDLVVAKGAIDASSVKTLYDALTGIKEGGRYRIVLNMRDVPTISSAGLGELMDTQTTCKRHKGELVLAEVPPKIKETIELAGLVPMFKVFDTEMEAVGSF